MHPYVTLFDRITVPVYGPLFIIGYCIGVFLMMRTSARYGIYKNDVLYCAVYAIIGLAAGAKAAYFLSKVPRVIINFDAFRHMAELDIYAALGYLFGGLTFYGGLIGAIAGTYVYCRQYHVGFGDLINFTAIYMPFIHIFGRIGCFLAGCCYGREYHGPFAVSFPYNELSPELSAVPRVPVQLMEAGANLIIFVILLAVSSRSMKRTRFRPLSLYMIMYAVARFLLEYLRGDLDRGQYRLFSTSQWISIVILIAVSVYEYRLYLRQKASC